MNGTRSARMRTCLGVAVGVILLLSVAHAQPKGKKEFVFHGKIEKIDVKTKTLSVNGQNVQGWMPAMTMIYEVDKADTLARVKVGDEITAKVYEGDFKTLYGVLVVPPKAPAAPSRPGGVPGARP